MSTGPSVLRRTPYNASDFAANGWPDTGSLTQVMRPASALAPSVVWAGMARGRTASCHASGKLRLSSETGAALKRVVSASCQWARVRCRHSSEHRAPLVASDKEAPSATSKATEKTGAATAKNQVGTYFNRRKGFFSMSASSDGSL